MSKKSIALALSLCAVMLLAAGAPAQTRKRTTRRHTVTRKVAVAVSGPENGLAGIKLYDTGVRLATVFGSPDVFEAVTPGGSTAGPGGGAAGGSKGGGLPGAAGVRGGGGGGGAVSAQRQVPGFPGDFDFGNSVLDRQGRPAPSSVGAAPSGAAPPGAGSAGPTGTGPTGGNMGGGGSSDRILYTRWVYNRSGAKFGFIVDKADHVIQCEAIGIDPGKVRTRRGITFGSSFQQIVKRYGAPDGYEISGDNIVMRYLSKDKCAFRLNRLGPNKPYVVTGIVVAAGKR